MRQEKLEYLQKKYESRLNPKEDAVMETGMGGRPGGAHGGPHGGRGRNGMAGGKPKNVKKQLADCFPIFLRINGN